MWACEWRPYSRHYLRNTSRLSKECYTSSVKFAPTPVSRWSVLGSYDGGGLFGVVTEERTTTGPREPSRPPGSREWENRPLLHEASLRSSQKKSRRSTETCFSRGPGTPDRVWRRS